MDEGSRIVGRQTIEARRLHQKPALQTNKYRIKSKYVRKTIPTSNLSYHTAVSLRHILKNAVHLRPLASESSGELQVLGLDGDSLGVDGSQVGVLEEGDEVGL
jgi:hypothetical protein